MVYRGAPIATIQKHLPALVGQANALKINDLDWTCAARQVFLFRYVTHHEKILILPDVQSFVDRDEGREKAASGSPANPLASISSRSPACDCRSPATPWRH
jgi:hypothetical protein